MGLIALQARYFQSVNEVKKEQFWFSVNRAMDKIADYIREQEKEGRQAERQKVLAEKKNLSQTPVYIDSKRVIASKDDPSLMLGASLGLMDGEDDVQDINEFVDKRLQENNITASIARLQQELKEKTGQEALDIMTAPNKKYTDNFVKYYAFITFFRRLSCFPKSNVM